MSTINECGSTATKLLAVPAMVEFDSNIDGFVNPNTKCKTVEEVLAAVKAIILAYDGNKEWVDITIHLNDQGYYSTP